MREQPGRAARPIGPSTATKFGVRFPETAGDSHLGAGWAGIISQRWCWGTVHFNVQIQFNREKHADLFVIVEGPHTWKVRPASSTRIMVRSTRTYSALVGFI